KVPFRVRALACRFFNYELTSKLKKPERDAEAECDCGAHFHPGNFWNFRPRRAWFRLKAFSTLQKSRRTNMFRRLSLIITLIAALGVGLAVAASTIQKDKTKSKDQADASQKEEKQKEKALLDASSAVFGLEMGAGGYLGVYLEEVTSDRTKELGLQEERGAIVMKVVAGGPGEKAGLKENDVIVSFNGRRVDSVRELQRLLSETPADRNVQIEVVRGGSHQTLAATLTRRSLQSFKMNWPQLDDKSMKMNEEAFK